MPPPPSPNAIPDPSPYELPDADPQAPYSPQNRQPPKPYRNSPTPEPPLEYNPEGDNQHDDDDPQLGQFENLGPPPDLKICELKIAQAFVNALRDISLDTSDLDPDVIELLCNPRQTTVEEDLNELDDELNPVLRLSLDIFLTVSNASQDTYTAVCAALAQHTPPIHILSHVVIKQ